jgi:outer membrane receptor protein involved in Fe transport
MTRQVTVSDDATATVNFALAKTATTLDQIVVTGTPEAQTKRELGNSIGMVNAAEVTKLAPPPNVQQLLNGVSGVRVQSGGGDVGSGGNTRIRGANSMSLASEPLLYIDGVRVNNAAADNGAFPGVESIRDIRHRVSTTSTPKRSSRSRSSRVPRRRRSTAPRRRTASSTCSPSAASVEQQPRPSR